MNDNTDPLQGETQKPLNVFRGSERDWTEQYAAIGEFVAEFEKICFYLRFTIGAVLQLHGLKTWKLGEIILNQRCFTAEPLSSCLSAIVGETVSNEEVRAKMKAFAGAFQKLSSTRNELLHGTWFIGSDVNEVTDNEAPMELHAEKRTPNSDGARVKTVARSLEEIRRHVAEARRVKELCIDLRVSIMKEVWDVTEHL